MFIIDKDHISPELLLDTGKSMTKPLTKITAEVKLTGFTRKNFTKSRLAWSSQSFKPFKSPRPYD